MSRREQGSGSGLQTLDRSLRLLEFICGSGGQGASLTELSDGSSLPKSTVHRILTSLSQHRLIVQDPTSQRYRPGVRLFELSQQALASLEVRDQALPELKELCEITRETVHLAILDAGEVIYIDKEESPQTIRMFSAIGKRGPAHCTGVGKVLLAALDEEELARVIGETGLPRYTDKTLTDPEELRAHLEQVRRRGYAIDDAEHEDEIRCVASPIFDGRGEVVASISLTFPAFRASRHEVEGRAPLVRDYAERISQKMGWSGPHERASQPTTAGADGAQMR